MALERKESGTISVLNTTSHIISLYGRLPKPPVNSRDNPTFRRRFMNGQITTMRRSVFNLLVKSTTAKLLIEQGDLILDGKYPEGWSHVKEPRKFIRASDINESELISDTMIDDMLKPKRSRSESATRKRGSRSSAATESKKAEVAK